MRLLKMVVGMVVWDSSNNSRLGLMIFWRRECRRSISVRKRLLPSVQSPPDVAHAWTSLVNLVVRTRWRPPLYTEAVIRCVMSNTIPEMMKKSFIGMLPKIIISKSCKCLADLVALWFRNTLIRIMRYLCMLNLLIWSRMSFRSIIK